MLSLLKAIKADITDELERANEKWAPFNSQHEGLSVLQEEGYEAREEAMCIDSCLTEYQTSVYTDAAVDELKKMLRDIQHSATFAAAEYIQVAAMCQKNIDYLEAKND